jgi:hypothetical protein
MCREMERRAATLNRDELRQERLVGCQVDSTARETPRCTEQHFAAEPQLYNLHFYISRRSFGLFGFQKDY